MNNKFDEWQYRIFRWVLFILFLSTVYKLLDNEFGITQFVIAAWK